MSGAMGLGGVQPLAIALGTYGFCGGSAKTIQTHYVSYRDR